MDSSSVDQPSPSPLTTSSSMSSLCIENSNDSSGMPQYVTTRMLQQMRKTSFSDHECAEKLIVMPVYAAAKFSSLRAKIGKTLRLIKAMETTGTDAQLDAFLDQPFTPPTQYAYSNHDCSKSQHSEDQDAQVQTETSGLDSDDPELQNTRRLRPHVKMELSDKFMDNFDPEKSTREMRKMNRRIYKDGRRTNLLFDDEGRLLDTNRDSCDCLDLDCPGCHFPCTKCGSEKCGIECRCNRRWVYDNVEVEGTNLVIRFPSSLSAAAAAQ